MIEIDHDDLRHAFGLGVAGNFAGHLEQAGEAGDFVRVVPVTPEAPRAVFPWYIPGDDGATPPFLHEFPIRADTLVLPVGEAVNLQIEPEAAMVAEVVYDDAGRVSGLHPRLLGAFNDCSIRREGATKISHKKNWGPASKGLASRAFAVDNLDVPGPTDRLRLACFLVRDGQTLPYGIDSPLREYSYYGDRLLAWIVDRLRTQVASNDTPIEAVGDYLVACGQPDRIVIGLGATRYTTLGASTYLRLGDEAVVVVYDEDEVSPERLAQIIGADEDASLRRASVLRQRVVGAIPD